MSLDYIKIGHIVNTRGIKGELKVRSFTDFQEDRYRKGNTVFIFKENHYIPMNVKYYNQIKNMDLLVFDGLEDINKVEQYIGCDVYAASTDETTLDEDEFHISDILGLDIIQNGERIGIVKNVRSYPQGDYLEVKKTDGSESVIPFRDEFILNVDLEEGFIEVIEMEGLL